MRRFLLAITTALLLSGLPGQAVNAQVAQLNIPSISFSADPTDSPGLTLSGQTKLFVSLDNTPMTTGQSFDWKTQCQAGTADWFDCGGGQHVPNGPVGTKSGGTTHIVTFQTDVLSSTTAIRAEAYNLAGGTITVSNVSITVT